MYGDGRRRRDVHAGLAARDRDEKDERRIGSLTVVILLAAIQNDRRRSTSSGAYYSKGQVAPPLTGRGSRFTRLPPEDQDKVLGSLEAHPSELLRGGFDGVKALLFMGYYRDARTWSVIGYDGPLLGRSP